MKSYAPYLFRSQQDVFYFRRIVPEDLSTILRKSEIKTSLRTTDPKAALHLSRLYCLHVDALFDRVRMMKKKSDHFGLGFTLKKSVTNPHGQTETVEIEVDPDRIDQELDALKKTGLFEDAKELVRLAEPFGININDTDDPPATPIARAQPTTLLLSDLIEKYCEDRIAEGKWTENTATQNRQSLDTLLFILGDGSCASIDREAARGVREKLWYYPTQRNKRPQFKGLTMEQIMELDKVETIGIRTINKHLTIYSSLFLWGKREKLVDSDPFEKLTVKDNEAPERKRLPFDKEDLRKIFESSLYTDHNFSDPYRYWTPLIALLSGARLNEIAQLELADIHQTDGIYVFDINKRTKNQQSIRQVPIHSKLIELGLLKYKELLEKRGETRLFPELTQGSKGEYSRKITEWFRPKYLPAVGIDTPRKVFHSFRGTLANALEDVGTPHEQIQQIAGHKTNQSMLQKHYLKPNVRLMSEWLEKVRFDTLESAKKFDAQ